MLGDPRECREHAKHCMMLAAEARTVVAKNRFEALAQSWLRLASDLEHARELLGEWGAEGSRLNPKEVHLQQSSLRRRSQF